MNFIFLIEFSHFRTGIKNKRKHIFVRHRFHMRNATSAAPRTGELNTILPIYIYWNRTDFICSMREIHAVIKNEMKDTNERQHTAVGNIEANCMARMANSSNYDYVFIE